MKNRLLLGCVMVIIFLWLTAITTGMKNHRIAIQQVLDHVTAYNQTQKDINVEINNKLNDMKSNIDELQSVAHEQSFVPETGLGESIDLRTIKNFVKNTPVELTEEEVINRLLDAFDNPLKTVEPNYMLTGTVYVQGAFGLGSGTVIKKTENAMYVLTCYHVVDSNVELKKFNMDIPVKIGYLKKDNTGKTIGNVVYVAEIIKTEVSVDLALLKINMVDDNLQEIKIAIYEPEVGDTVYSVGCPLGMFRTFSKGILSNKKEGFYVSDNTTTYGNSGGSLYNVYGELIGVPARVQGYSASEKQEIK